MEISIDRNAGFCSGVIRAVRKAEEDLKYPDKLYCLGEIVHNEGELNRLSNNGLIFINHEELKKLKNVKVLIRAHGEPPSTYELALRNNIELIDASCQVVLRLQDKIERAYSDMSKENGQVVIYGNKSHPELIGLNGRAANNAIIIESLKNVEKIDFSRPISLFSQTTKSLHEYRSIIQKIKSRVNKNVDFQYNESICKQVSGREGKLKSFAKNNDVVIFVGGKHSSNAKFLYQICKTANTNSYFVSNSKEIEMDRVKQAESVGITGATSTPQWQMEEIKEYLEGKLCI